MTEALILAEILNQFSLDRAYTDQSPLDVDLLPSFLGPPPNLLADCELQPHASELPMKAEAENDRSKRPASRSRSPQPSARSQHAQHGGKSVALVMAQAKNNPYLERKAPQKGAPKKRPRLHGGKSVALVMAQVKNNPYCQKKAPRKRADTGLSYARSGCCNQCQRWSPRICLRRCFVCLGATGCSACGSHSEEISWWRTYRGRHSGQLICNPCYADQQRHSKSKQ